MGIPYYFSYLIKNHRSIIETLKNSNINNLYLDCNSIIYEAIDFKKFDNRSQFENMIIQYVVNKIELLIKTINPTDNVLIAFDGVPPFAKLNQQRNRRYKSWYQNTIFNKNPPWDTCSITPGTLFMDKLNNITKQHFSNKKMNNNIILSLSDIPGEGEHKIYEYIRNNNHNNKKTIIYGLDADLIMLSLNHLKYCNEIYLYRETPQFIRSLDNSLNPDETYLLNITKLGNQIYKELVDNRELDRDTPKWLLQADNILETSFDRLKVSDNYYGKIEDYIFICFLLGNDFMPHFPAINIRLNGFTNLLDLYKTMFKPEQFLINSGKIVWSNFKRYIGKLAENEENFLKHIYKIRDRQCRKVYPETTPEECEFKFVEMPTWERNIEKFINPYENGWEWRYYYSLFDEKIDKNPTIVPQICKNYLETLQWTYYYYSRECVNWRHFYKYHYPPLLTDLYKHIPYFDSELVLPENKKILHPHILLSIVLPKNSLTLLPEKIYNYLLKNNGFYYRENNEFIYAFCKYFWEGHVKFPDTDIEEYIEHLQKNIL